MAKITFKRKVEKIYNYDDTLAYEGFNIPRITRNHCDMNAFRQHKRYGAYANSDLFEGMINRAVKQLLGDYIKISDPLPEGVTIDATGFLVVVTINV